MTLAGESLLSLNGHAVLMKGGHLEDRDCTDLLFRKNASKVTYKSTRVMTKNTHGTGCTLSAAIAALLAQGHDLDAAVKGAHSYLKKAIQAADDLSVGNGHGPVNHFHAFWN